MQYRELLVLIPSHGLEDFPTDLNERQAAGLLNAFSVIWHPALIAAARCLPTWHRADDPPAEVEDRLFLVPENAIDWLPHDWIRSAEQRGAVVVAEAVDRDEWLELLFERHELPAEANLDLADDFLAFGFCHLQTELLTRQMHYFSNLDEVLLQREIIAAAEAWVAGDSDTARNHLGNCFESLMEGRERFYPIECFLIDLCLIVPELADEKFLKFLDETTPANLLVSGQDLLEIREKSPESIVRLQQRLQQGDFGLVGGEQFEQPVPLVPLESFLWDFEQGRGTYHQVLGQTPSTWGRRRYGFSTLLPQVLKRSGFKAALHVALDDGIYPDQEQSKIQWEGTDGSVIDALSRIPLAADSASSYLRLPQRMSESMESDQVAALIFARWPEIKSPWFRDLQRMHKYSPVLGRFVSFDQFIADSDLPGRLSSFGEQEYLSPFLVQLVAREESDAVSRFQRHQRRYRQWLAGDWLQQTVAVLRGSRIEPRSDLQARVEANGPDQRLSEPDMDDVLEQQIGDGIEQLCSLVLGPETGGDPGILAVNPHSTPWVTDIAVPLDHQLPQLKDAVQSMQIDGDQTRIQIDIPPCGFRWIRCTEPPGELPVVRTSLPIAEENVLRNEHFEVHINERTGGIAQVKEYGRKPNRLSQQLAFRFLQEKSFPRPGDPERRDRSFYTTMHCERMEIVAAGPAFGEIETQGFLIDPESDRPIAGFRQRVRLWRGRRQFELNIEIDPQLKPTGSPWATYYASRFAWNDEGAALTRSVMGMMHGFQGERIESPEVFEIATESHRTAILCNGLSFHRRTGPRMLDSILVTEAETVRQFQLGVELDNAYPLQASRQFMTTVPTQLTQQRQPARSEAGWFMRIVQPNVQIVRLLPPTAGGQVGIRLVETEGRHRTIQLELFRPVAVAWQRDLTGARLQDCRVQDGVVFAEVTGHEICDLELEFA